MRFVTGVSDRALAHAILRLTLGVNLAIHGLRRIPVAHEFAIATVRDFNGILPSLAVAPYAMALPYAEATIGVLLVLGAFQRPVLAIGALLMMTLTFGTAMRGEYAVLAEQLGYELVYFVLLATREWDGLSVDTLLNRRSTRPGGW